MDMFDEANIKINAGCTIASMMSLLLSFISVEEAQCLALRKIAQEVERFENLQKRIGEENGK